MCFDAFFQVMDGDLYCTFFLQVLISSGCVWGHQTHGSVHVSKPPVHAPPSHRRPREECSEGSRCEIESPASQHWRGPARAIQHDLLVASTPLKNISQLG